MESRRNVSEPNRATAQRRRETQLDIQGVLFWEADPWAVHLTLLNPSAVAMLGYAAERIDADDFLKEHIPLEDWRRLLETMHTAAVHPGPHHCRHQMVRSDGSTIDVRSTVYRDQSNGSMTLTGVTVDVSEIVNERDPAGVENAKLLIQNLREYGVFMLTLDGKVASWNPGAYRLKGYAADEIIGAPLQHFFPEDEVRNGTPEALLKQAELDGHAEYDGWLLRKDGSKFWASLTLGAVTDANGRLRGFSNVSRDLTERRETEHALQRSEQQFRLLVDSLQDYGVFTLSLDGRIENWNPGAQRLKGYRAHEVVGTTIDRFFPPEELAKGTPQRLLADADLHGQATYEGWLVRKDGSRFWTLCTISAVEDEHGRLRGFSNVARDLTLRKQMEDTLLEREERLRLLIESLQDYAIFMVSADGRVETWSPGAERVKGYTAAEIIGTPITRFFPPEELEKGTPQRLIERAAAVGRAEYEGWIVRSSGSRLWVNVIFSAVRDASGTLLGFSNIGRDLTERMRSDRGRAFLADVGTVLAGSLEFQGTCDAICRLATGAIARACIVVTRTNETIRAVGIAHVDLAKEQQLRAALQPVQYDTRIVRGLSAVLHTGQSRQMDALDAAALVETLGIQDEHVARELADGSSMCVALTVRGNTFGAVILLPPHGAPYTSDDLRIAEELARRSALALDNARLFEQAQTAVQLREQVLAVVSHDLRTPLGTIEMAATSLAAHAADSQTAKLAAMIQRASCRMTSMIRDLLDFASIERGQLSLHIETHDARALTSEAVASMQPFAADRRLELEADGADSPALVPCDRDRILQVFANLIGNAVKFTEPKGLIRVACTVEPSRIVFSVRDTGRGIAEDVLPRIFDRYWSSVHGGRESFGLGLAIAKGIIESHGGVIWAESKVGHGTTFFFTLPR